MEDDSYKKAYGMYLSAADVEKIEEEQAMRLSYLDGLNKQVQMRVDGIYEGGEKYIGGLNNGFYGGLLGYRHCINLTIIRQNVRKVIRTSVFANALLSTIIENTVGAGLVMYPMPDNDELGYSDNKLEDVKKELFDKFYEWCTSGESSITGCHNFFQQQKDIIHYMKRDNDVFYRLNYRRNKPLSINAIDPSAIFFDDVIDINHYDFNRRDQYKNTGIKRSKDGLELGFYVQDAKTSKQIFIPKYGKKTRMLQVIHYFKPEYPDQYRGIPLFAHCLQEFKDLNEYKLSVVAKAKNQAQLIFVVENDIEASSNPFGGVSTDGRMNKARMMQDLGPLPARASDYKEFTRGVPVYEMPMSSTVTSLRRGDKIKPVMGTVRGDDFEKVVETMMITVCSSIGIPKEIMDMKFGNNYSASRATIKLYWDNRLTSDRQQLIFNFLDPIYRSWLRMEMLRGKFRKIGISDINKWKALSKCQWVGNAAPEIDPVKSAEADKIRLAMGAITRTEASRNVSSSNFEDNVKKLKVEDGLMAGIKPVPDAESEAKVEVARIAAEAQVQKAKQVEKSGSNDPKSTNNKKSEKKI